MTINNWVDLIVAVLSGLAVCVPLVIKLVQYIRAAIKEKNWPGLMQIVLNLMSEAEQNYSTGAERKAYVIAAVKAMEKTLNYDVDEETIGIMIDLIITATKKINVASKNND